MCFVFPHAQKQKRTGSIQNTHKCIHMHAQVWWGVCDSLGSHFHDEKPISYQDKKKGTEHILPWNICKFPRLAMIPERNDNVKNHACTSEMCGKKTSDRIQIS